MSLMTDLMLLLDRTWQEVGGCAASRGGRVLGH